MKLYFIFSLRVQSHAKRSLDKITVISATSNNIIAFHVTHASGALHSHELSGEGINNGSHTYFFLSHKDMDDLPE